MPLVRSRAATTALILSGTAAYLGARAFVLPATPILLGGDQGFFWMYADRMLHGERPYRDFFQFSPPGTDVMYLVAFALFGPHIWVTNAMVVALGVALGGACFCVARDVMADPSAILATAIFVVLVVGQALSGTHHGWSTLAVMCAVAVLSAGENRVSTARFASAGALLGLAAFFTQTHAAAALFAFAIFAWWQAGRERLPRRRILERFLFLFGAFGVVVLGTIAYFVVTVGARPIWTCLVSYVWEHAGRSGGIGDQGLGLPGALTWRSVGWLAPYLLVYTIAPTGYALALRRMWRERNVRHAHSRVEERVVLLWLVGVFLLVEVSVNRSWIRVLFASMPAVVLLFWASEGFVSLPRLLRPTVWTVVVILSVVLVRSTHRHHSRVVDLPAGKAATDASNREKLEWLTRHVAPGGVLFAADRPSLYLPLRLRSPLFLDAVAPTRQTTIELAREAILQLQASRIEYVVWSSALESAKAEDGLDGVVALRGYLHEHYHRVQTFDDGDEAWTRD